MIGLEDYYRRIRRILRVILVLNLFVASIKIYYGYATGILSITTDGFDSFFDAIANLVGIVAVVIASRPPNKSQRYGYSKVETFSAIIISFLLFTTGYTVLSEAIGRFYGLGLPHVGLESYIVIIFTLMINIPVAAYEYKIGHKLKSPILISDSKHTMVDVFISIGVLIGLVFIQMGYTIVDPILSIIFAIIIVNTGISILLNNIKILLDTNVIESEEIESYLEDIDGIKDLTNIRSRGTQSNIFVDFHLVLDGNIDVNQAYKIKQQCKDRLFEKRNEIKDIMIEIDSLEG